MTITTKNFNTKLAGVISSAKTQRSNLQELISFGLNQYKDHGNTTFLSIALNKCIGVKSLPTVTIKDYIKAHANLKWAQLKDKSHGFKKDGKDVKVTIPTVHWYNWEGAQHNTVKTDMDLASQIKSLIARAEKAMNDHHIKDVDDATTQIQGLKILVA